MAAIDTAMALSMVKTRLNRLQTDTSLDEYLRLRILAAISEAENIGIDLDTCGPDGLMYLIDYTVWSYQNRDESGGMPDWLRLRRRELWLRTAARKGGDAS